MSICTDGKKSFNIVDHHIPWFEKPLLMAYKELVNHGFLYV